MKRSPHDVSAGSAVYVRRRFIRLHAGEHRDWNVGQRFQASHGTRRLNFHGLSYFRYLRSWWQSAKNRIVVLSEFPRVSAVDRSKSLHLLLVRAVNEYNPSDFVWIGRHIESRDQTAIRSRHENVGWLDPQLLEKLVQIGDCVRHRVIAWSRIGSSESRARVCYRCRVRRDGVHHRQRDIERVGESGLEYDGGTSSALAHDVETMITD